MRRFVLCFVLGGCATLGLAGVGGAADTAAEALARLDQLIDANDVQERAIAYEQIRSGMKGEAATARFAARLPALPPDRQIELLRALADRGDAAALPAIASAA
jgi:hypothetical protein